MRHNIKPLGTVIVVLAVLVGGAAPPLAAQTRQSLVADAITEFNPARQRQLLRAALNPSLGPPDSAFAVGVQMLAQNLLDAGQDSLAAVWLKWAIRQAPDMQPDPLQFPENVVSAFSAAQDAVRGELAGGLGARPVWRWPAPEEGPGILRILPSAPASQLIVVQGVGSLQPGAQLSLDPGTYSARASAEGYVPVDVSLEILPGVTTELAFNLSVLGDSVISGDVELLALSRLVRITAMRAGQATCGAGVLAGRDGLVLTTYAAIRGAESLTVEASSGAEAPGEVTVATYDPNLNVAVLRIPLQSSDSMPLAQASVDGAYAWGLNFPECGPPGSARTRLGPSADPTGRFLTLEIALAGGDQGGPIIDNTGAVVGLGVSPTRAVPIGPARGVLDEGRSNIQAGQLLAVRDVSLRERHLYGRVDLRSDTEGAIARITPLERWHWPEVARTASLPLLFAGPMGRYQMELVVNGEVRKRTELQIQPGQVTQLAVDAGGGGMGVVLGIVGLGAAGVGACVLFLCGGDDGPPPPDGDGEFGSITIAFPNPAIRSLFPNR